jgi:hypothetical protein
MTRPATRAGTMAFFLCLAFAYTSCFRRCAEDEESELRSDGQGRAFPSTRAERERAGLPDLGAEAWGG